MAVSPPWKNPYGLSKRDQARPISPMGYLLPRGTTLYNKPGLTESWQNPYAETTKNDWLLRNTAEAPHMMPRGTTLGDAPGPRLAPRLGSAADPIAVFARRSTKTIMTRLQATAPAGREAALQLMLDALDKGLWGEVRSKIAKGMPLEKALTVALANGFLKRTVRGATPLGCDCRCQSTLSGTYSGSGEQSVAATRGTVKTAEQRQSDEVKVAGYCVQNWQTILMNNATSTVRDHRCDRFFKVAFAPQIEKSKAFHARLLRISVAALETNPRFAKFRKKWLLLTFKHPESGDRWGLFYNADQGYFWVGPAPKGGLVGVWNDIKKAVVAAYNAIKDGLKAIAGLACEVTKMPGFDQAATAGGAAMGVPPQASAKGASDAKKICGGGGGSSEAEAPPEEVPTGHGGILLAGAAALVLLL